MSTSELLILRIVREHGGALPYHTLAGELRTRFEHGHDLALSFGRRSALDTVHELGALGALELDEQEEDDPRLQLTAYGEQLAMHQPAA
jgi:hypothetical protein